MPKVELLSRLPQCIEAWAPVRGSGLLLTSRLDGIANSYDTIKLSLFLNTLKLFHC